MASGFYQSTQNHANIRECCTAVRDPFWTPSGHRRLFWKTAYSAFQNKRESVLYQLRLPSSCYCGSTFSEAGPQSSGPVLCVWNRQLPKPSPFVFGLHEVSRDRSTPRMWRQGTDEMFFFFFTLLVCLSQLIFNRCSYELMLKAKQQFPDLLVQDDFWCYLGLVWTHTELEEGRRVQQVN